MKVVKNAQVISQNLKELVNECSTEGNLDILNVLIGRGWLWGRGDGVQENNAVDDDCDVKEDLILQDDISTDGKETTCTPTPACSGVNEDDGDTTESDVNATNEPPSSKAVGNEFWIGTGKKQDRLL